VDSVELTYLYHSSPVLDLGNEGRVKVSAVRLSLTDRAAVEQMVSQVSPHIIIHTAALSNTALCEKEPTLAFEVIVWEERQKTKRNN